MDRDTHKLQVRDGKFVHTAFIAFAATGRYSYMSDADANGYMKCETYDWLHMKCTPEGVIADRECPKRRPAVPLDSYVGLDCYPGITYIMSCNAREHIYMSGWWDAVEDGRITLTSVNDCIYAPWLVEKGVASDMDIVLEAPPTVVAGYHRESKRTFVWCDTRNFGWSVDTDGILPQDEVRAIAAFIERYWSVTTHLHLGPLRPTAAAHAFRGFVRSYLTTQVQIHGSDTVTKVERAALYGGRCECWHVGTVLAGGIDALYATTIDKTSNVKVDQGALYHLDANSLYPSVAQFANVPVRLIGGIAELPIDTLLQVCRSKAAIAEVLIETTVPAIPCRLDKKVVWPVGTFWSTLCGPEILLAYKVGKILKCSGTQVYDAAPIFSGWIKELYDLRQSFRAAGQHMDEALVKTLINSVFGKFAQHTAEWIPTDDFPPLAAWQQWLGRTQRGADAVPYRTIGWKVQKQVREEDAHNAFPAITAYVHSLGRVRLWSILETAGHDNVYYMDTDAIICNAEAYVRLADAGMCDEHRLGGLKVKGVYRSVRTIARQAYMCDGELTLSGCSEPYVRDGDVHAQQLSALPIEHYLSQGKCPGVERRLSQIRLARPYVHGNIQPNGRVLPIRINPGDDNRGS